MVKVRKKQYNLRVLFTQMSMFPLNSKVSPLMINDKYNNNSMLYKIVFNHLMVGNEH